MVYNKNQNIDESSENTDELAQNISEPVQNVDTSTADQKKEESGGGMTGPEPDQVKAESESDQDNYEDVDIGFSFENTSNIDVPKLLIDRC